MRRAYLFLGLFAACLVTAVIVWRSAVGNAPPVRLASAESPGRALPLSRIVLFNTGLGYFQREGEVEGDTRIDLTFPVTDINDLLKSLVVDDEGRSGVISYDGQEPLERVLQSFTVDLTYNPTFGQVLNQARGEKVEVTTQAAGGVPASLTGTIMGMESSTGEEAGKETHLLNLMTTDGLRRVPLTQVQRLRFLNPTLEEELRRSLGVLASTHHSQNRNVRVQLRGAGKRPVKIGYVLESPIWKSSYRLVLDSKGKSNTLQGFAVVENTSDEDWRDVRMVLMAGRPISYTMDLYQPLFLPRPTVEPRAFASLRPPTFQGKEPEFDEKGKMVGPRGGLGALGALGGGFNMGGQLGIQGGSGLQLGSNLGFGGGFAGALGGMADAMPGRFGLPTDLYNRYQTGPSGPLGPKSTTTITPARLTYEELLQRRAEQIKKRQQEKEKARQVGSSVVALAETAEELAASADTLGEEFHYTLDQKVNLPRQMSALLPVVRADVKATPVSVYNKDNHPRFPMRALRIKNTTGQHLQTGPVSVYDDSAYAGDATLPDLQPEEERLISYAMDLGLEVKGEPLVQTQEVIGVRLHRGDLYSTVKRRGGMTYRLRNRAKQERTLLLEHHLTEGWELAGEEKPVEKTRSLQRFQWALPSGKVEQREVVEEQTGTMRVAVSSLSDATLEQWLESKVPSKAVKDALRKAAEHRSGLLRIEEEVRKLGVQVKNLREDQDRLRENISRVLKDSTSHKRYVEKFDKQEEQLEKLQGQLREKTEQGAQQRKAYDEFLARLSAD